MSSPVIIYTDGACIGNPGPGGWAAVLIHSEKQREMSGGEAHTTNNRMEMMAIIRALQALKGAHPVQVFTDSKYVSDGMQKWLAQWQRNNYRKSDGKPVKNADLWKDLDILVKKRQVSWHWVRGHNGDINNERADVLARQAAEDERDLAKKTEQRQA